MTEKHRGPLKSVLPVRVWSCLAAIILVLLVTAPYGAGISPDSVAYISAARELCVGDGYTTFDREPLVSWPPAFPTVIAAFSLFGVDAPAGARYLNAIVFGLIVLAGSYLLNALIEDKRLVALGVVLIILSKPLQLVSMMVWSEPLFILAVTIFLISFQSYLGSGSMKVFAVSVICAALACLTRYIGVTVVMTAGLALLLRPGPRLSIRVSQAIAFVSLASAPVVAWWMRNFLIAGSLTGPRAPAESSFPRNLTRMTETILVWFLPLLLGVLLLWWARRKKPADLTTPIGLLRRSSVTGIFICVYLGLLILSAAATGIDALSHRLLAPVYLPLLVLILLWVDRRGLLCHGAEARGQIVTCVIAVLLAVTWPVADSALRAAKFVSDGIPTYTTKKWLESELLDEISGLPDSSVIYSNAPDAIYILTGRSALFSPYKNESLTLANSKRRLDAFTKTLDKGLPVYLFWFTSVKRKYLYTVEELHDRCELELRAAMSDGEFYTVRSPVTIQDQSQ